MKTKVKVAPVMVDVFREDCDEDDETAHKFDKKKLFSRASDKDRKTHDDCASIYYLHEAGILDNLRAR